MSDNFEKLNPQVEIKPPEALEAKDEYGPLPENIELKPESGILSEMGEKNTAYDQKNITNAGTGYISNYQEKYQQIENILSDGLLEFYQQMNSIEQQKFKLKGEEVAREIIKITTKPRFRIEKIITLIRNWLKIIPGINRFFLEQTTKIKADKIVQINNRQF